MFLDQEKITPFKIVIHLPKTALLLMECAAGIFKCHAGHGTGEEMGLHACTFPILTSLLSQMSGAAQPIEMMDESVKKEMKENRNNLAPQLLILFCFVLRLSWLTTGWTSGSC